MTEDGSQLRGITPPNVGSRKGVGHRGRASVGAVLFCKGDQPECLELYTFGNEYWNGVYEGFAIEENPLPGVCSL
jgi:hypothetical protein